MGGRGRNNETNVLKERVRDGGMVKIQVRRRADRAGRIERQTSPSSSKSDTSTAVTAASRAVVGLQPLMCSGRAETAI